MRERPWTRAIRLSWRTAATAACLCAAVWAQNAVSPEQLGDALLGQNSPATARLDAARQLAASHLPLAADVLVQALDSHDPATNMAAAEAIAQANWTDAKFIGPMENLLGNDPAANRWVAQALIEYPLAEEDDISSHLIAAATNKQFAPAARTPLVEVLGRFATKDVAEGLLNIVSDTQESVEVRQAASSSLSQLSGQSEFGQDPLKWQTWWLDVKDDSPADFAAAMATQRSENFASVVAGTARLGHNLDQLLESLYFTAAPAEQGKILDAYLTNDAPEIRRIGAHVVEIDVGGGRPMTAAARSRLLTMATDDPTPAVRAAAIAALGLDPTAADFLQGRLKQETDPDALAAVLNALAPRQDPAAISVAVTMLQSPSPIVAQAAADLIAVGGGSLRDPNQTPLRQQIETVLTGRLDNPKSPADALLRPALVAALASLGDVNAYDRFMKLASSSEPEAVRIQAIGGLGQMAKVNPDIAGALADFVDSPTAGAALRLKAVQELAGVPTTAYVDRLVDRLHVSSDPDPEVRAAVWQTVEAWLGRMSDDRLLRLAERMRNEQDYTREVEVRRFYADTLAARKTDDALQTAASQWETIATREMESLNDPSDAAADFARVLAYYQIKGASGDDLPHNPFRGEIAALLAAGPPYDAAIRFASSVLGDNKRQPVVPDVLEQIARVANSLATGDPNNRDALNKAILLVKTFNDAKLTIPPSLSYVTDNLAAADAAAKQNLANLNGTP